MAGKGCLTRSIGLCIIRIMGQSPYCTNINQTTTYPAFTKFDLYSRIQLHHASCALIFCSFPNLNITFSRHSLNPYSFLNITGAISGE